MDPSMDLSGCAALSERSGDRIRFRAGRGDAPGNGDRHMAFTSQALAKTEEALTRTREKMARLKETAEEAIGNGIQVTEVGGTAFLMGLANAKWGEDGE